MKITQTSHYKPDREHSGHFNNHCPLPGSTGLAGIVQKIFQENFYSRLKDNLQSGHQITCQSTESIGKARESIRQQQQLLNMSSDFNTICCTVNSTMNH